MIHYEIHHNFHIMIPNPTRLCQDPSYEVKLLSVLYSRALEKEEAVQGLHRPQGDSILYFVREENR